MKFWIIMVYFHVLGQSACWCGLWSSRWKVWCFYFPDSADQRIKLYMDVFEALLTPAPWMLMNPLPVGVLSLSISAPQFSFIFSCCSYFQKLYSSLVLLSIIPHFEEDIKALPSTICYCVEFKAKNKYIKGLGEVWRKLNFTFKNVIENNYSYFS